jgi:hypothetical protein
MSHRITLPSLLTGLIAVAALAACGTSSSPSSSSSAASSSSSAAGATSAPGSSSAAAAGATSCPSSSTVSSDLGVTVGSPTSDTGRGGLPPGATGVSCAYVTSSEGAVTVSVASGVPSNYLSTAEGVESSALAAAASGLNFSFTPVSGLGSQAVSFSLTLGAVTESGVLAQQGSDVVDVFTEGTSASLSQIETLVKQLL